MGHSPPRAPHHETPETYEAPNPKTCEGAESKIRWVPNQKHVQKHAEVPNRMIRDPTQSLTFMSLPDAGLHEPTVTQNSVVRDSGDVVEDRIIRHQGMPPDT